MGDDKKKGNQHLMEHNQLCLRLFQLQLDVNNLKATLDDSIPHIGEEVRFKFNLLRSPGKMVEREWKAGF